MQMWCTVAVGLVMVTTVHGQTVSLVHVLECLL